MPPNTRASAISSTTAEKLGKDLVPDRTSDVTENAVLSPKIAARIYAAEPLTVEWPDGYSGWAGVPGGKKSNHGVHPGSGSVLAFPSVSPPRMAVMGRQKTYRYFESQHAIAASAIARFSKANRCALSVKLKDRLADTWDAMRLVANINVDMFLPIVPLKLLTVYGMAESDLGDRARQVAESEGVGVQLDPEPLRNIFTRSDQYNFVRRGIPALAMGVAPTTPEENNCSKTG
jgi:Peptidase family M28